MTGIGAADAAIYTGVCLENNDPTGQGRIKYCVPQLSGTASFGWALPVVPGTTPIGANISVAFEGGDRNRPLYWPDLVTANTASSATYATTAGYSTASGIAVSVGPLTPNVFQAATTTVDLGGGFMGARFAHGASWTPSGAILMPYDGASATNLFAFNVETIDATNVVCSIRHLDGTVVVVGEGTECFGLVWE